MYCRLGVLGGYDLTAADPHENCSPAGRHSRRVQASLAPLVEGREEGGDRGELCWNVIVGAGIRRRRRQVGSVRSVVWRRKSRADLPRCRRARASIRGSVALSREVSRTNEASAASHLCVARLVLPPDFTCASCARARVRFPCHASSAQALIGSFSQGCHANPGRKLTHHRRESTRRR
jgi:hypothetical protein